MRRNRESKVLGRLYPANASCRESLALRMLLLEVSGCKSIDDVRQGHPTFYDAARALGLISDSLEWLQNLHTASKTVLSVQFRTLFCIIIDHCAPYNPEFLLTTFFSCLTNDFEDKFVELWHWAAINGKHELLQLMKSTYIQCRTFDSETRTDLDNLVSNPAHDIPFANLSKDQGFIHDAFLNSSRSSNGKHNVFVLLAPAGCGKTFLINSILTTAKQSNRRIIPCATSALAASLLGFCRTAHTTFKIPISVDGKLYLTPHT